MTHEDRQDRVLTELDHVRLSKLVHSQAHHPLASLLEGATVVHPQDMPTDVVTMYSQVEIAIGQPGRRQRLTLCYPRDADAGRGFISVLSPVGCSLLGLPAGAEARWQTPDGVQVQARVEAVLFQPEATGDFVT